MARPTTLTFTSVADNTKCRLTKGTNAIDGDCDMSAPGGHSIVTNGQRTLSNKAAIALNRGYITAQGWLIQANTDDIAVHLDNITTTQAAYGGGRPGNFRS